MSYVRSIFLTAVLLLSFQAGFGATYYSRNSGSWATAANWSTASCGGVAAASSPGSTDSVVICNGYSMTLSANATVKSLTILNGGTFTNGSGNIKTLTISSAGSFNIQDGGTYIHNNTATPATTIFNGTEIFTANSTFRVDVWDATSTLLITGESSNFGNLILNWDTNNFLWNNNGLGYTRTIAGNFTVQNFCATYLDNSTGNNTITVGGNFTVNDGYVQVKYTTAGNCTVNITGSLIVLGTTARLNGIYNANGNFALNAASVNISNGVVQLINTDIAAGGQGNATVNITGTYTQSGGKFYGIYNISNYTAGVANYTIGSISFTGGAFIGNYQCHTGASNSSFVINGDVAVSFSAATDLFSFYRLGILSSTSSKPGINVTIAGNLTISGTAVGEFHSSASTGAEIININGNVSVSNGTNNFNVGPGLDANGHAVTLTIAGALSVSGGNTFLSYETNALIANINGNTSITNGTLSFKGKDGTGTVNFNGSYTQSGGIVYHYNNTTTTTASIVNATVLGDFQQTGGTINYGNNATSTVVNTLTVKGANYTLGGTGIMTHTGAGTSTVFGQLNFQRAGTITMTRSGSHDIQQVKQSVLNGCTLDLLSGYLQVASHATAAYDYLTVNAGAVLDLRANQVASNATAVNSGLTVADNGRLRTSHPSGLYNNTTVAAIKNSGNLNYFLGSTSVIEYYGTISQVLTGINIGLALSAQHKYGILEINNTGVSTFVSPTALPSLTGNVFVRTELRMTSGELNLANSAASISSGGRDVTIENSNPSGITRTNGYIHSEAQDFSAAIKWIINSITGSYIVPWGYSSFEYIPLTYKLNSSSAGTVKFATYNTPANNLPWPPGVNNLYSKIGLTPDNRDATVDRFWLVQASGTPQADVTFTYRLAELPVSPYNTAGSLVGQDYLQVANVWEPALAGQTASSYAVTVPNISTQQIWTLTNTASPLPVTWLSFNVTKNKSVVDITWSTATETNNDHFNVERTADFKSVEVIGRIAGKIHSASVSAYSFTDRHPLAGVGYYRIHQYDIDGKDDVTAWAAIKFGNPQPLDLVLLPNPAGNQVTVFTSVWGEPLSITINDARGRLIRTEQTAIAVEGQGITIQLDELDPGLYFCNVKSGDISQTARLVKE